MCILFLSETKIGETFQSHQFEIGGYRIFRTDWFYVNENIPCGILYAEDYLKYFEVILLEFSIRNGKWSCFSLYKPPDQNEKFS